MLEASNFIKIDTLAQVFHCEFYEISKNTFLTEHVWTTSSNNSKNNIFNAEILQLFPALYILLTMEIILKR